MERGKEIIEIMIHRIKIHSNFNGLCQILSLMESNEEISTTERVEIKNLLKSHLLPYRIFSSNPLRSSYFKKRNRDDYWWPFGDKRKRIRFLEAVLKKIEQREWSPSQEEWKIFLYGKDDGQIIF